MGELLELIVEKSSRVDVHFPIIVGRWYSEPGYQRAEEAIGGSSSNGNYNFQSNKMLEYFIIFNRFGYTHSARLAEWQS